MGAEDNSSGLSSSEDELRDSIIKDRKKVRGSKEMEPSPKRLKTDNKSHFKTSMMTVFSENVKNKSDSSGQSSSSDEDQQDSRTTVKYKETSCNNPNKLSSDQNTKSKAANNSTNPINAQLQSISPEDYSSDCSTSSEDNQCKEPNENRQTNNSNQLEQKNAGTVTIDTSLPSKETLSESQQKPVATPTRPIFRLAPEAAEASVDLEEAERMPLFFSDVQELLAFAALGINYAPRPGPWCKVTREEAISHTVFILVEGLSADDFVQHRGCFPSLDAIFSEKMEVITPSAYEGSFVEELTMIPMSKGKQKGLLMNHSCLEGALVKHKNLFLMKTVGNSGVFDRLPPNTDREVGLRLKKARDTHRYKLFIQVLKARRDHKRNVTINEIKFLLNNPKPLVYREREKLQQLKKRSRKMDAILKVSDEKSARARRDLPPTDRFARTDLMLSPEQCIDEGIPLPLAGSFQDRFSDYVMTKDLYRPATANSPLFAVDCEMVMTTAGEKALELARVSIVNEKLECVYDELVKPENRVTNYLTAYSGVTAAGLADVTKRLGDVHRDLRALLPTDAILVGHSVGNDLHALRMVHPYLIDTSVIFNVCDGGRRKAKLATLSDHFLGEKIQTGHGHCSTEDSAACMKLVQLKLANGIEFGDNTLAVGPASGQPTAPTQKEGRWETFALSGQRTVDARLDELMGSAIVQAERLTTESRPLDLSAPAADDGKARKRWIHDFTLADPLFGRMKYFGKPTCVIGTKEVIDQYREWTPGDKRFLQRYVKVVTTKDTREVFEHLPKVVRFNSLTIGHAHFDAHLVENAAAEEKELIFTAIDQSCKKVWESVANDGMCVILFGGRAPGTNGVCFVRLNNNLTLSEREKRKILA